MNEKPLTQRMREMAEDHEKYEQGGGASLLLNEGAEALEKAIAMLQRMEFSVNTHRRTGKDTQGCPCCEGGCIVGLPGEHREGCELAGLLRELAP